MQTPPITSGSSIIVSRSAPVEEDRGQQHGRDDGDGIGLEQIGGHAGAIADIVADIVGDHGRVARIVLGDAGLDLADEIGADIGALGEDAAAEPREDRDQRGAEAQRDQRLDDRPRIVEAAASRAGRNNRATRPAGRGRPPACRSPRRRGRRVRGPRQAAARGLARCAHWRAPRRSCRYSRRRPTARRR